MHKEKAIKISRKKARERFEWIKESLEKGGLGTDVRLGLVAEVAAFRSLDYITQEEAVPYLQN